MSSIADRPKADTKESVSKGFAEFMDKQETKLMLSMIPPSENPDALSTLLHACFSAGHSSGTGMVLMEMLTAMLSKPRKGPPDF